MKALKFTFDVILFLQTVSQIYIHILFFGEGKLNYFYTQ